MQSVQAFIRAYNASMMEWMSSVQTGMPWGGSMKRQGHRKEEEMSKKSQDFLILCRESMGFFKKY